MRIWYLALLLTGLLLFASACPRDTGSDDSAGGNGMTSSTTEQADDSQAGAATHGEGADNPCVDEGAMGEGEDAGENPCGEGEDAVAGEDGAADGTAGMDDGEAENPCNPCGDEADTEEGVVNVILQTSKGNIKIAVHKDWAPIGAEHFLELVRAGYYDGAPWFRVIPGFMAQTGVAADPEMTAQWQQQTIQDEGVVVGNLPGKVSFGRSGAPNSRSTHFFINYVDNSRLDSQGFPAFGEVVEGMDVVRNLFATGENPQYVQPRLASEGIEFFRSEYPEGDVIEKAWIESEE